MDNFKKVECLYIGYLVAHKAYNNGARYVLFNDRADAQKCLTIMHEYQQYSIVEQETELIPCTFTCDDDIIVTSIGVSIKNEYYTYVQKYIEYIENTYDENTWGYLDGYVELFGRIPQRPYSKLDIFCCLTCLCCFQCCYECFSTRKSDKMKLRPVQSHLKL